MKTNGYPTSRSCQFLLFCGILFAPLSATLFAPIVVSAESPHRITDGLVVLYDFANVLNDKIPDVSGQADVVDLQIETPKKVDLKSGSVRLNSGALIAASQKDSRRLAAKLAKANAISIEAWIRTDRWDQTGPARIVTLSRDANHRDFTLGHDGNHFEFRLRRSGSNNNGLPGTRSNPIPKTGKWMHLVAVRRSDGSATIYVDGVVRGKSRHRGAFKNWDPRVRFALGNELDGQRSWQGELAIVAVYDRGLTIREVGQNLAAGLEPSKPSAAPNSSMSVSFENQIAPLLSNHCLECHDAPSREGGLDLSHRKTAMAGGDSGPAIDPGKADDSLVWTSVESDDMPHDRAPLSDAQKALLKQWIAEGAEWSVEYVDPAVYRSPPAAGRWIRRLTTGEYIETVRSVFQVEIGAAARERLPVDRRADGFANTAYNLNVDFGHIDAYAKLSEIVAGQVDARKFAKPYAVNRTHTDRNWRPLIEKMGRRIFRGDLDEEEIAVFRGIASTAALTGADFETSVRYVIEAMIQSPRFLYRLESRAMRQPGPLPLERRDPFEMATRISYAIIGGPPDEKLFQAAMNRNLETEKQVRAQIKRLWEDPRCIDRSLDFVTEWLDLDRLEHLNPDQKRFPNWSSELAADMRRETLETFRDWVWERDGPLAGLLNVPYTYASPRLTRHYNLTPKKSAWAKYDLSKDKTRGGILTHGSVLTVGGDNASMVTRGLFVLRDLLFSEVGDPPPGLDLTPVPTRAGLTHRDVAIERIENESCGGCHRRFEPLAFALERYDGLGSYRETDEYGNQLRWDGEILFPGDAQPRAYESASEMMDLLAGSDRVAECLSRKVMQYTLGRPLDATDAAGVRAVFKAAGGRKATYPSIVTELLLSETLR